MNGLRTELSSVSCRAAHLENAVPVLGNLLDAEYRTDEFRIHIFQGRGQGTGERQLCTRDSKEAGCACPASVLTCFLANASGRSRSVVTSTATTGLCAPLPTWGEKARRRDTAIYKYVATACPDFRKVRCHHRHDQRFHPKPMLSYKHCPGKLLALLDKLTAALYLSQLPAVINLPFHVGSPKQRSQYMIRAHA